jgi:hypothetical protein
MKKTIVALTLLISTPSLAQTAPDVGFMQKVISALQAQRNSAMDAAATADVKAGTLQDQLTATNAELARVNAKLKAAEDAKKEEDKAQ